MFTWQGLKQSLAKFLSERRVGDGDTLAPSLVTIMAKLVPRLHVNVKTLCLTFLPPWESLEQDILEYTIFRYHGNDLKKEALKEDVKLPKHVLPVSRMWSWLQFEAADKATQLLNRFEMTRSQVSEWEKCGQVTNYST